MGMGKKIIFTGTTGMVGHYIDICDWHTEIVKTTHQDFDITDLRAMTNYFDRFKDGIEIIVHMAAETDVDKCEKDKSLGENGNTRAENL